MAFVTPVPVLHDARIQLGSRRHGTAGLAVTRQRRSARLNMVAETSSPVAFSTAGMTVEEFFERSSGLWRSQRSSHILAFAQFEAITSEISIESVSVSDERIKALAAQHDVPQGEIAIGIHMRWEGESDWDDDTEGPLSGETTLAVTKGSEKSGKLLRSSGYAESIPAVGEWHMTDGGVFVLETLYEAAAAEERIWFATKDLRIRVSQIRTSSGAGVVSASMSTEIRRLKL
ncbi:Chromophore lyase CpcS/CpeS 3 [Gracilariopsis chorda]|uniref:Chromophore lyase CpcS/CpeS 3 n=1 Tax=Gracilariopsis chorda TaxID=448386 RepID=A0A2V3IHF3_9FLOR|nr:Chromophore lyase CpcS/CpeS 3 [Gracilariopsis chorda]|eukprot:PXF41524.1 Chromophore lyase CpcS/CpeS 3 [Gracilariopsis chorda]